ncbi:MAG: thioredoxin family protein [Bacteroidetes bacterium]|nr:thioredoxin family protein [Bacteroidota bacterium]
MKVRITFLFVFLILAGLFSNNVSAQVLQPVTWSFSQASIGENKYELTFKAVIDKGWSIYGLDIKPGGPIATAFEFTEASGYKLIGKMKSPEAVVKFDPNFNMELAMISNIAVFKQTVEVLTEDPVNVKGELVFMSCDATSCLPPDYIEFEFRLPGKVVVKEEKVETTKEESTEALVEETVTNDEQIETAEVDALKETEKESGSLLWDFIKGFLGGLLALLTPCVFPMIPLTVSYFLRNAGKKRSRAIRDALFYGISIVFSYVVLGMAISIIFGADTLNMLATSPAFNIFFFALLVFFAAAFLGAFELTIPASWSNKLDSKAEKSGGLIGVFLMGVVFVLVSFSCTGPIVGTLLVEAASGGSLFSPAVGMLGFSLALAIPFSLFAVFPTALKSLPKSGGWMNSVKVVLGFIVLAFALKFLATADSVAQWGLFSREFFIVIWMSLFLLLGLYLLGKIKFAHDSDVSHISVPRLFLAIVSFSFVFYLLPGLFGAPLKTVSSFLPPITSQSFDLSRGISSTQTVSNDIYTGKSVKEGVYGLLAFTDYEEGMEAARKAGKPVFLDFTGFGCSNCRKMEAAVWSDPRVLDRLKNNFVKISLYVDDRTMLPEDQWFVDKSGGREREIRRVGQKWSIFQAERYEINTQPYYLILDHNENSLVTPRGLNTNIEEYIEFLDEGLEKFKESR